MLTCLQSFEKFQSPSTVAGSTTADSRRALAGPQPESFVTGGMLTLLVVALLALSVTAAFGVPSISQMAGDEAFLGPNIDPHRIALPLPPITTSRSRFPVAGMLVDDVPLGGGFEPTIAVNPTNPLNIAYSSGGQVRVSADGGTTWLEAVNVIVPNTHVRAGDPTLAFDRDGRLFWSYLGRPLCDVFPVSLGTDLFIAQCDPLTGEILPGYPISVTEQIGLAGCAGNRNDKEWLAVDSHAASPFANRLYLAWTNFLPGGVTVVLSAYSSDQGMTWSPPLQLGTGGTAFNWPVHITTAPNGDVYAAYHRVGGGLSGFVRAFRSIDGGVSFAALTRPFLPGEAEITTNVQTPGFCCSIPGAEFWLQGSLQPWVLPDPNTPGRIYVIANDDPDNNLALGDYANVYIAITTDYGVTWSAPMRIDGGPGTTLQVMPTASIDAVSGAIVVHYYDNRNGAVNADGNFLLDLFATVSLDGGSTFSADFQVNDLPFDPDAGAPCQIDCGAGIFNVWADVGGQAYAVTDGGSVLTYDGDTWEEELPPGTPKFGVWGSSLTDVFVCGAAGTILHYDGNQFTAQSSGTTSNLYAIHGRSGSDVYAAGANGAVVRYDGNGWTSIAAPTSQDLWNVWANPSGDVWVVGERGTVYRYDGTSWTAQPIGTGEPNVLLGGLWGTADDSVWASAGIIGEVYRWDGVAWTTILSGLGEATRVWGSSATDIFVLGAGTILHFDGSEWSSQDVPARGTILGIHGTGPGNVFAVGFGSFTAHYDGANWTEQENPLVPQTPTRRIGEYNGVALAGQQALLVWCGNTNPDPVSGLIYQQSFFDSFRSDWTGISVVDLMHPASELVLEAPSPNPARHSMTLAYSLPRSESVDLSLYDVQGRRVTTLIHGRQPAGRHVVSWDGERAAGEGMTAGVYFLRLDTGRETRSQRVTIVR
jgi:hypothetical protein